MSERCPRCPQCQDPLLPGSINCSCGWKAAPASTLPHASGWCGWHDGALDCPLPGTHKDGHDGVWLCRYHVQGRDGPTARHIAEYAHARLARLMAQGFSRREATRALYYSMAGTQAIEQDCKLQPKQELAHVRDHLRVVFRKLNRPLPDDLCTGERHAETADR